MESQSDTMNRLEDLNIFGDDAVQFINNLVGCTTKLTSQIEISQIEKAEKREVEEIINII